MPIKRKFLSLSRWWIWCFGRRTGQTLVEYALIIAFISIVAISVLLSLGQQVKGSYTKITSALATAQASH